VNNSPQVREGRLEFFGMAFTAFGSKNQAVVDTALGRSTQR
jgi:hypothetical protein